MEDVKKPKTKKKAKAVQPSRDEDGIINNEHEVMTALNESSMAVLFTLYQISASPLAEVMLKMREYPTYNKFLEAAASSLSSDFYPIFHPKGKE